MQHRRDQLAEARPEALLGTRRRFLTLAGAAAVLAFSTRLPGAESARARSLASYPFTLGVASGDPLPDSVVLWTRLAPRPLDPFGGMPTAPVDVDVGARGRRGLRARGRSAARRPRRPEFAHSVHVDVAGLEPGREYFYRFVAAGERAPPAARAPLRRPTRRPRGCARLRLLPELEAGYYTRLQALVAEDARPRAAPRRLHLRGRPRPESGAALADPGDARQIIDARRVPAPLRAVQGRPGPAGRARRRARGSSTLDDHEVVNNCGRRRRPRATPPRRRSCVRRANAFRAYWEHMPLRLAQRRRARTCSSTGGFRYGGLAEFSVLDTRQYRSDQANGDGTRRRCAETDPARTIPGAAQEQWLLDGLGASPARWNVLAQQVLMAQLDSDPGAGTTIPNDAWDGYAANRDPGGRRDRAAPDLEPGRAVRRRPSPSGVARQGRLPDRERTDRRAGVHLHVDLERRRRLRRDAQRQHLVRREPAPADDHEPTRLRGGDGDEGRVAHRLPRGAVRHPPRRAGDHPRRATSSRTATRRWRRHEAHPRLRGALARGHGLQRHGHRPARRRGRPRPAHHERGPDGDPALHRLRADAPDAAQHHRRPPVRRRLRPSDRALAGLPLAVVDLHADRPGPGPRPAGPGGAGRSRRRLRARLPARRPGAGLDAGEGDVGPGLAVRARRADDGDGDELPGHRRRLTRGRRRPGHALALRVGGAAAVDHARPRRGLRHQRAALPAALRRCPQRSHHRLHARGQHRRRDVHGRPHRHVDRVGGDEERAPRHPCARRAQAPPDGHGRAQQPRGGGGAASPRRPGRRAGRRARRR